MKFQQRSIHHKDQSSLVEFTDEHHPAQQNNHVHGNFSNQTSMMAIGHFTKIFDPAKNGQQLTEEFFTDLKNEFAKDDRNVVFSSVPFREDNTKRPVELCSLELYLERKTDTSTTR